MMTEEVSVPMVGDSIATRMPGTGDEKVIMEIEAIGPDLNGVECVFFRNEEGVIGAEAVEDLRPGAHNEHLWFVDGEKLELGKKVHFSSPPWVRLEKAKWNRVRKGR